MSTTTNTGMDTGEDIGGIETVRRGVQVSPELKEGLGWTIVLAFLAASGQVVVPIAVQQTLDRGINGPGGPDVSFTVLMGLASAAAIDPALELGVAGSGLSGGQAQRVAIARAFYRRAELRTPVLILDEPSSALDAATEADVIASLRSAAADGAIVIVISHREAVIAAADRVASLEAVRHA